VLKYDADEEEYTFSSGRVGRANCGIIGIGPDLSLADGYDGGFDMTPSRDSWHDDAQPLTPEERRELADYMIARWTACANQTVTKE
jgi:hypothetical protein